MAEVVLKFSAFSNISYDYESPTGYTPEEWDALPEKTKDQIYADAIWEDINAWEDIQE